jgi:hypothetical protein
MRLFEKYLIVVAIFGSSFMLSGCSNSFQQSASDDTPPVFTKLQVQLFSSKKSRPLEVINLINADLKHTQLDSAISLQIIASARDAESGISTITIESDLSYECSLGHTSATVGRRTNHPISFLGYTEPPALMKSKKLEAVVKPFTQIDCEIGPMGKGPMSVYGIFKLVATNGKGLKTYSKTFSFSYSDFGSY